VASRLKREGRADAVFRQILFVNWKAARFGMIPLIMAAFGLPLLSVQGVRHAAAAGFPLEDGRVATGAEVLQWVTEWSHLYPALALALGTVLALMLWNWDHRGKHVYPLSLPLPRWKYVLLKMGAGGVLLLIPVGVLWLGSLLAVSTIEIPEGLRAYPTAITFRFLLATLIAFAVFFALAAGTMRTAVILLIVWIALLFLGEVAPPILAGILDMPMLSGFRLLDWILDTSMSWPGPFEVFAGNWLLIDV
jgi:hypothetical protein